MTNNKKILSAIISAVCAFLLTLLSGANFLIFEKNMLYFFLAQILLYLLFALGYFLPKIALPTSWWCLPSAIAGWGIALAGVFSASAVTNNWACLIILMISFCISTPALLLVLLADTFFMLKKLH